MDKEKIDWCCNQKRGISLIEPKAHLDESYIKESEKDLEEIKGVGNKWKVIIAYYSCYEALYSLLMKCGIKSEIHDCSIALMDLLGFEEKEINFLKDLKKAREGNQYYLKSNKLKDSEGIKEFILKCKEVSKSLNSEEIDKIREIIK